MTLVEARCKRQIIRVLLRAYSLSLPTLAVGRLLRYDLIQLELAPAPFYFALFFKSATGMISNLPMGSFSLYVIIFRLAASFGINTAVWYFG